MAIYFLFLLEYVVRSKIRSLSKGDLFGVAENHPSKKQVLTSTNPTENQETLQTLCASPRRGSNMCFYGLFNDDDICTISKHI